MRTIMHFVHGNTTTLYSKQRLYTLPPIPYVKALDVQLCHLQKTYNHSIEDQELKFMNYFTAYTIYLLQNIIYI